MLDFEEVLCGVDQMESFTVLDAMDLENVVVLAFPRQSGHQSVLLVHISEVTPQIAGLGEGLAAQLAVEGPHLGMLAEVVTQVATLAELLATVFKLASEVEFYAASHRIIYLDRLVPLGWYALKLFWSHRHPIVTAQII